MQFQPGRPAPTDVRDRLGDLLLRDARKLGRRLDGLRGVKDPDKRAALTAKIAADVVRAERRVEARRSNAPAVRYPAELPVTQAREELLAAIERAQVVVVAGETGSGKTTQLPKICLELGRGVRGLIGHTQPRRLAARTVADRIAEELGVTLGEQVGYQVRFSDRVSERTMVKLMTDGILLAEMQRDRDLLAYDTIIVDEAHERSLNIDFLLGYLRQILPRRPDLKLIITSATIDPQRFSQHFGDAPIVEVSGRTYPVEVRYRPLDDEDAEDGQERDQIQGICAAVDELSHEGPGDVLVFLSGEREIRDTADALKSMRLADTEILPLYARLSTAEQHRAFQPHPGRRIVLATNVAETSVTVPGVRYVVDPGTARISRYSHRTKVQRLPIEPVSQASANQRKGRCGRVAEGVCIRLYSGEDFLARPEFTDPEILRTNLASVILQMTALGLGDVAAFPFVDPPEQRSVRDAVGLLEELGAIRDDDGARRLTAVGRGLAALPVDPRLGRMIVEAGRNHCLREVLIIAAALSIQDPRERPSDRRQAADEAQERFAADDSDFLTYLNLWQYVRGLQRELTGNQFRRRCKAEFLHYLRIREWQDLFAQLRSVAKELGMTLNESPAEPQFVHQALLAGLLSHVGLKEPDKREYLGARNARFAPWPGSALAKQPPRWVMAAELVETSRLWGRTLGRIEPEWAEHLAGHLVKRSYSEPRWAAKRGMAIATERVTLYGVPLVTGRTVGYGRIDPPVSRELFIRHALIAGEWRGRHAFLRDNERLLADLADFEDRVRRDVGVDDEQLFAFYDARIPESVVSTRHFDAWWKRTRDTEPGRLTMTPEALLGERGAALTAGNYPETWRQGDLELPLTYRFEPGAEDDGVTVHIPLAVLNAVSPAGFDWLVPGLREQLVTALIRSLPKNLRRNFVPTAEVVAAVMPRLRPGTEPLTAALGRELARIGGVAIPPQTWRMDRLPDYLRMSFAVSDGGKVVGFGKDLAALRAQLVGDIRVAVAGAADDLERRGLRSWAIGALPRSVRRHHSGHEVEAFPALVDEGDSVGLRVFLNEAEQRGAMWQGTRRLLLLNLPAPVRTVHGKLGNAAKLAMTRNPHGSVAALLEDCAACTVDTLMREYGAPAWDADAFGKLHALVAADLPQALLATVKVVQGVLAVAHGVESRLAEMGAALPETAVTDIKTQYAHLIYPGFVTVTGRRRLSDLERYLRAIERRIDKIPADPARDLALMTTVAEVQLEYDAARRRRPAFTDTEPLREIRWMIEELRVSLFAQQLGTRGSVSEQRLYRALANLGY